MDRFKALGHAKEILRGWDEPIWKYRTGGLGQLVDWCTNQATEEAVKTGGRECCCETLEIYLRDALDFALYFHKALNPAGARLLLITDYEPPPDYDKDKKLRRQWIDITKTVWHHQDLDNQISALQDTIGRKLRVDFPNWCDLEALGLVLEDYLKLPHLHHPWLEWCMFDALVWREVAVVFNEALMFAYDPFAPFHSRRNRLEKAVFARTDRKRAQGALKKAAPYSAVSLAMIDVYMGLSGPGEIISPTRVRETMAVVDRIGGRWVPACWVLIDRAMQRDQSTWNLKPP